MGPQAGAAGEFEYLTCWGESIEGASDIGNLGKPLAVEIFAMIETSPPVKPFVVFTGAGAVVVDLILNYIVFSHRLI